MMQVKRSIFFALSFFLFWNLSVTQENSETVLINNLQRAFANPPVDIRPETWFHLIGGNVSKAGLTVDLGAVASAGISGIQLFHGRGGEWPGVSPQITTLSASWDDMIAHVGDETKRLGLNFTMQNCPGWAMSGGPWITPDAAMRHLIWSREDLTGGELVSLDLARPQPSEEDWRDYRDVAVLAFPTPQGDNGRPLLPSAVQSNRTDLPWVDLLAGKVGVEIEVEPAHEPVWIEVSFEEPVYLRSIELPPVELLMLRRNFDPASAIRVEALGPDGWVETGYRRIPRGTWQDRQPEMSLVLAFSDYSSRRFRITFENQHPMGLTKMQISSAARLHDWMGQAAFALRSLDRSQELHQDPAAWVAAASIIDLSAKMNPEGKLTWEAPPGQWTILRFGHVNTGVENKPAPPEATGFECDKLSSHGADQHFAGYIGRLTKAGGAIEGQLKGMLIDSWECYTQTWTPAMEQEFLNRRGYALRTWLPALAGWVMEDPSTSERFLRDWRATISDLLVDNYFGRLAELGRASGLKLSFETAIGDVSPGDILQYFSKADIPMCEFWQPNDPHWGGFETKPIHPTVSAAHIYGKPRIAAEAFTNVGLRWNEHPFLLKHTADRHFALGINHLVFHTYTHNPHQDLVPGTSFGSRIGTPFIRGQTWWKYMPLFTEYLARCQLLLQQGHPVADVLWYLGDDLDHKPRQDSPFPNGYQFDYLNFDALINRISVENGRLQTPEGMQWRVLWLPARTCQRLLPETLAKVQELLEAGATVIGPPPKRNPSLSGGVEADTEFAARIRALWGEVASAGGDRRIGKGRLIWGNDLETVLLELGIEPDVAGARSAVWCHRQTDDADIYFISAGRLSPLQANLRFRAKGRPEFWDPMTGASKPLVVYDQQGDHTVIPVELPAAGSTFILFRKDAVEPAFTRVEYNGKPWMDATDLANTDREEPYPNYGLTPEDTLQPWIDPELVIATSMNNGEEWIAWRDGVYTFSREKGREVSMEVEGTRRQTLDRNWTLSFPAGWDAPSPVSMPELMPWSALDDPAARAFSGTAVYQTKFQLEPGGTKDHYLLDLGRVANIAEIFINGEPVITLWAPPFRVDITPYIRSGSNNLEVKVTNTWYNRLIHDAALPEAERKTWTINSPGADAELEPAGIVGPVILQTGKAVKLE
jgi:hypothetical protein